MEDELLDNAASESSQLRDLFSTPIFDNDFKDDPFAYSIKKHFELQIKTDDDFCVRLWSSLANVNWYLNGDKSKDYGESFRSAGSLIASIRGSGHYMEWYCSGPYAQVDPFIASKMAEDGWTYEELHPEIEDIEAVIKPRKLYKRIFDWIKHPIKSYRFWRFIKALEKLRTQNANK